MKTDVAVEVAKLVLANTSGPVEARNNIDTAIEMLEFMADDIETTCDFTNVWAESLHLQLI